jgi:uncharacterized protein with PIN domain
MLGKLARELRLVGIDCEYDRNLGGMAAFREARRSGRVFLTRAGRLRELPGAMFVQSQVAAEQVEQIKATIDSGLRPAVPLADGQPPAAPNEAGAAAPDETTDQQPETPAPPPPADDAGPGPKRETPAFGRCLQCNAALEKINREQARPSVPFFVYQIHHEFRRCPKCRKVFWPGNHVADMERRVETTRPDRQRRPRFAPRSHRQRRDRTQ